MTEEQSKEFPCDLCGAVDAIEVPHARKYTENQPIHICTRCGFVYVKQRRSAKAIADTWANEWYKNKEHGYTSQIPAVKARLTYVADFINSHIPLQGKEVCDIGAGEGDFLKMIRDEYGARVFGIEPSHDNCARLTKMGMPNFDGTIEEYITTGQSKNYQADVVTIVWTLENCVSCRDMLSAAYSIVKDRGYVVVATGSRILVPFKKPLSYYLDPNFVDTHCFRFSANTLRGMLAVSGFEATHINRYIDSDWLCVIAKKRPVGTQILWEKDDYKKVADFFERWHKETEFYR
ncbi:methyltransferase domain-containing protein [Candidatus Uhrbacteria bacterium]|nr:methyltransferase domain-containing protein [Candidatus Uhrbacteria bacterium]